MESKVFIRVPGVYFDDLHNWTRPKDECRHTVVTAQKQGLRSSRILDHGDNKEDGSHKFVKCNDQDIALFRVDDVVYAVQAHCPHAGGPLYLGDIEELPGEGLCVRCPWHSWRVHLTSGKVKLPQGRNVSAVAYPVKVASDGTIYIGFDKFSQQFFDTECDF